MYQNKDTLYALVPALWFAWYFMYHDNCSWEFDILHLYYVVQLGKRHILIMLPQHKKFIKLAFVNLLMKSCMIASSIPIYAQYEINRSTVKREESKSRRKCDGMLHVRHFFHKFFASKARTLLSLKGWKNCFRKLMKFFKIY